MKKILLSLTLFAGMGFAQIPFVAQKSTDLTAAAEVITVQQPSGGGRFVKLVSAYVDCSVACTITLEINGTAATATTLAPKYTNPRDGTPTIKAFSSSDVGVGTVLQKTSLVTSGAITFDLTGISFLQGTTTSSNFTIRTSSITGTVNITIKGTEQ